MKFLTSLLTVPVWLTGPLAEPSSVDWPALVERFGLPLATLVIVLWSGAKQVWVWGTQLRSSVAEVVRLTTLLADRDSTIEAMHRERLQREQQLVAGLGPRLYDAALLIREGAQEVATVPPTPSDTAQVAELTSAVRELLSGLDRTARGG